MYYQSFGLRQPPFNLTSDPDCVYLVAQHMEALAAISYGVLGRRGLVVLTGDAGTGKTTLLMRAMKLLPADRVKFGLVVNPTLSPSEFLEAVMLDFGIDPVPASKARRLSILQHLLWDNHLAGHISALVVDEAHKLSPEVLEEIRLLGNIESPNAKLLQIVLVGQPELDGLLDSEQLRQFKQRIALRCSIGPLAGPEIAAYIRFRWSAAGGAELPLLADAVSAIGTATGGIPRLINITCENALADAFGEGSATVEARHVQAACRDLLLRLPAPPAPPDRPAPVPAPAVDFYPMRTLERYDATRVQPSLLGRLRSRFRSTQRIETA